MLMQFLRKLSKNLPSLLTAIILSVTVWILAVTAKDPTDDRLFPRSIPDFSHWSGYRVGAGQRYSQFDYDHVKRTTKCLE